VAAVAPGAVETPMTAGMNQKALDMIRASIPLGRMASPEDIWRAVKFIFDCDYFTGETIDVHGGAAL
jgi:3-oxoacyl-[acyl-carrier protein] reductase